MAPKLITKERKTDKSTKRTARADFISRVRTPCFEKEAKEQANKLQGKNISLFSLLQTSASELGLSLKDLNEKKTPLKDTELIQVSVEVNLKEVSIDKLTSFLKSVESKEGKDLVKVTRLKTKTRFDNDQLLDVRMTVSTWRKAS